MITRVPSQWFCGLGDRKERGQHRHLQFMVNHGIAQRNSRSHHSLFHRGVFPPRGGTWEELGRGTTPSHQRAQTEVWGRSKMYTIPLSYASPHWLWHFVFKCLIMIFNYVYVYSYCGLVHVCTVPAQALQEQHLSSTAEPSLQPQTLIFASFRLFCGRQGFSRSPGWLQTHYVAKADLQWLIFLLPPPNAGVENSTTMSVSFLQCFNPMSRCYKMNSSQDPEVPRVGW